jgi:hypothetical protein
MPKNAAEGPEGAEGPAWAQEGAQRPCWGRASAGGVGYPRGPRFGQRHAARRVSIHPREMQRRLVCFSEVVKVLGSVRELRRGSCHSIVARASPGHGGPSGGLASRAHSPTSGSSRLDASPAVGWSITSLLPSSLPLHGSETVHRAASRMQTFENRVDAKVAESPIPRAPLNEETSGLSRLWAAPPVAGPSRGRLPPPRSPRPPGPASTPRREVRRPPLHGSSAKPTPFPAKEKRMPHLG